LAEAQLKESSYYTRDFSGNAELRPDIQHWFHGLSSDAGLKVALPLVRQTDVQRRTIPFQARKSKALRCLTGVHATSLRPDEDYLRGSL